LNRINFRLRLFAIVCSNQKYIGTEIAVQGTGGSIDIELVMVR
jgi:hypothetical protein